LQQLSLEALQTTLSLEWTHLNNCLAQECDLCAGGDDNYCAKCVMTYNGKDWGDDDKTTYGGYSNRMVVNHK